MIVRLLVKTPPGQAAGLERQLRLFLLAKITKVPDTYINPEGTEFAWVITCTPKKYIAVCRNSLLFQNIAGGALDAIERRKWLMKAASITGQTMSDTRAMFENTSIEVVKNATNEELDEQRRTWTEKIKNTWRRLT
jgi:hypothetical protein